MSHPSKTYDYATGFAKIRQVFDFTKQQRLKILDIACGDGRLGKPLVDHGHQVWGIDAHPDAVYTANKVGIRCTLGDVTKPLPFQEHTFDVVLLLDILEHLQNPRALLEEAKRLLDPGGTIIISLPNHFDIRSRLEILCGGGIVHWAHRKFPEHNVWNYEHIRFFRLPDILELLKITGLNTHTLQYNFMAGGLIPRRLTPRFLRTTLLKTFPNLFSGKFVLSAQTIPIPKIQYIYLPATPRVF